jgi:hypothetical protein
LGVQELLNIVALLIEDKDNERDIILEVIFDKSFWIWHVFFHLLGGKYNVNVLDYSPLIA